MTVAPLREADLITMLDRRYDKVAMGARRYATAAHVANGLSWQRSRIADYIAVDFHSQNSGPDGYRYPGGYDWYIKAPVLHGHEIKVSRSDWLAELRDPSKAETFRRHMHFWWLVVSDASIVRDDLPEGWGLIVASRGGLRARVKPTPNTSPDPMPPGMTGALIRAVAGHRPSDMVSKEAVV